MVFGIMELFFALIVLGLGYVVLYLAAKSDGGLQGLGKLIGRIMLIISTIMILLTLYVFTVAIIRTVTGNRAQSVQPSRAVPPASTPRPTAK